MTKKGMFWISVLLVLVLCIGSLGIGAAATEEPAAASEESAQEAEALQEESVTDAETEPETDGYAYYTDTSGNTVAAEAWASGESSYYYLRADDTAVLRVLTDASREDVTAKWYYTWNVDGGEDRMDDSLLDAGDVYSVKDPWGGPSGMTRTINYKRIIGAEGLTFEAAYGGAYLCVVTGTARADIPTPMGADSVSVTFSVYKSGGGELGPIAWLESESVKTELGQSAALTVSLVPRDGCTVSNVVYSWYRVDRETWESTQIPGADGPELVIDSVTADDCGQYRVSAEFEYTYSDPTGTAHSGNSGTAVYPSLMVENLRGAELDTDVLDSAVTVTRYEYPKRYGNYTVYYDLLVPKGEPVTLKAIVEADDAETVSTQWSWWGDQVWNTSDLAELTVAAVNGSMYYNLDAIDALGDARSLRVHVSPDLHFTAKPAGAPDGVSEVNIAASPDGSFTLKVDASSDDMSAFEFTWFKLGMPGGSWQRLATDRRADELTVVEPGSTATYLCRVTDGYGNLKRVYFHVNLNGDLYGTTGRVDPDPMDIDDDGEVTAADAAAVLTGPVRDPETAIRLLKTLVGLGVKD